MFIEHNFSVGDEGSRVQDARSIGSILNSLREVAALRETALASQSESIDSPGSAARSVTAAASRLAPQFGVTLYP